MSTHIEKNMEKIEDDEIQFQNNCPIDDSSSTEDDSESESEAYSESSGEEPEYNTIGENIIDPNVKATIISMLTARGYEIIQDIYQDDTQNVKKMIASKDKFPNIHIIFATDYIGGEEIKFNTKIVKFYIKYIDKFKLKHTIIVHQGKITSRVKSTIGDYVTLKKIKIETLAQCELKYNITLHVLNPKFVLKSKEESKEFKIKYGTNFKKMLVIDPIARFYGYEKGDVIVIYRKDEPADYRIVI